MKIRLDGLKELDRALQELTTATAKNVAKRALERAGAPIAASAQANAPKRSGKLKAAVIVSGRAKGANKGAAAFGAALRSGASKAEARQIARDANRGGSNEVLMYVGVASDTGQGVLQEFGTQHHAPQPFLRPAWDENKDQALKILIDELTAEVEKATARAARKAAKLAAKGG